MRLSLHARSAKGVHVNKTKAVKIAVDIMMAGLLVAVMGTALVQEAPHEWLGLALFVLMIAHIVLNRKWLASIFRGRHDVLRVVQIVILAGLVLCMVGQVASSLVLSKYAFGFLPALPGASWARRVHMLCSYWAFVLAFAHVGLHIRKPKNMAAWQLWTIRALAATIACFGLVSAFQLGMPSYLAGQVQFAAADFQTPLALVFARYASVAVLVATVFYCIRTAMTFRKRAKSST